MNNNYNDDLGILEEENNDSQDKLCITNLSLTNKIAVFVEMEENHASRMKMC